MERLLTQCAHEYAYFLDVCVCVCVCVCLCVCVCVCVCVVCVYFIRNNVKPKHKTTDVKIEINTTGKPCSARERAMDRLADWKFG